MKLSVQKEIILPNRQSTIYIAEVNFCGQNIVFLLLFKMPVICFWKPVIISEKQVVNQWYNCNKWLAFLWLFKNIAFYIPSAKMRFGNLLFTKVSYNWNYLLYFSVVDPDSGSGSGPDPLHEIMKRIQYGSG